MARQLRIEVAGGLYHVLARGNEKKTIFKTLGDRNRFLLLLSKAHNKYSCLFYVYSLLPNHYHLLVEIKKKNLSKAMHFINTSYSIYFNKRHRRVGHLFQGRFKSIIIEKEPYLLELSRYIHSNGDRAGFIGKLYDKRWTSFCYYMGSEKKPPWLHTEWILDRFGKDWSTAKNEYKRFVEYSLRNKVPDPFEKTYKGVIIGTGSFIQNTKKSLKKKLTNDFASYKSFHEWHTVDAIIEITSRHFKIPANTLFQKARSFAPRRIAIYMIREHTDLSINEIGKQFNISGSAVSQNVKAVKKDKETAALIKELERFLKNP